MDDLYAETTALEGHQADHADVVLTEVLEVLPDAALAFDHDGVVVIANRRAADLLGCSPHEVVGRRIRDVLLDFSLAPLRVPGGATAGLVLAVVRPATSGSTAPVADEHAALLERAARIGSWEEDARSGTILWSTGMYEVLGVDPAVATPSVAAFLEQIHPEDLALLGRRRAEARSAGGDFFVEVRLRSTRLAGGADATDGGEPATVSILGHVELTPDGQVRSSTGTVQDVTGRLRREQQLHVSNARLQRAFDAAPIGMSLVDARPGRLAARLMANGALAELTGLPPEDLLTAPLLDSIDPRDRASVGQALAALLSGEVDDVRSLQARVIRPGGQERWVNLNGALIRDHTGMPDYLIAHMVDVTDLVRAQQETAAAQQLLRAALDANPDGFAVYRVVPDDTDPANLSGRCPDVERGPRFVLTQINASGAATAADDRSLVGLTIEEILDDAERSGIPGLLRRAVAAPGTHRLRTSYASSGWAGVLDVVAVRVDDDHVLATWRDVSAQVASENVLIEAYGRAQYAWDTLHLAMDAAHDAILVLEVGPAPTLHRPSPAAITIRHLNLAAAVTAGLDRDDVIDADLDGVFPGWRRTTLPATIRRVAASGLPRTARIVVDGPQGPAGPPEAAFEATVSRLADRRVIVISRDVTLQEATNRQIEESRRAAERTAAHDPLTDLPNRARLEQRLRHALMTCGPAERVAVLFCDLDDLKAVNDTYGHRTGDLLLRAVAHRLASCTRGDQTAARISGDEFVLVLPALAPDWQPDAALRSIRDSVEQPLDLGGTSIAPRLTIGCYVADPATMTRDRDPADVLAAADQLMYEAKTDRRRRG